MAELYLVSREYDSKHVGYVFDDSEGNFRFDTTLLGNSNAGHEYSAAELSDDQRWELMGFLKRLLRLVNNGQHSPE